MDKRELEVKGETVDEAVSEGLSELGLDRSEVEVIVVDEGRKGFLGLGNREATVRLVSSAETEEVADEKNKEVTPESTKEQTIMEDEFDEFDDLDALPDPELLEEEETANEIISQLLERMAFDVTVETKLAPPDDLGKQVIEVNVEGEDLEALIGRRGEILADLQYLCRLMVSQRLRRRVDFVIDVDGYRRQREEGLTRLAERMADKVIRRNRPVTLEPMPPYERRLIHVALREHEFVYTKSIGSGNDRRVRIFPKN